MAERAELYLASGMSRFSVSLERIYLYHQSPVWFFVPQG